MLEINTPEISIDEIMEQIKKEVKRHQESPSIDFSFSPPPPVSAQTTFSTIAPLAHQEGYHMAELLKYQDMDFIHNAYTAVLRRPPDIQGGALYLEKLHTGTLSKIDILGRLRYSREGRVKKVPVKGLFFRFFFRMLQGIPLLGRVIKLLTSIVNLPTVLKNIQTLESTLYAHNRIAREDTAQIRAHLVGLNNHIENLQGEITYYQRASRKATRKETDEKLNTALNEIKTISENAHNNALNEIKIISENVHNNALNILNLQHTSQTFLEETRKRAPEPLSPSEIKNMSKEKDHLMDAMYVAFENRFRGDRKEIKERVQVYLPQVQGALKATAHAPILDVGCGRGEWLEFLKEQDIKASGLDLNRIMVSQCRELGLDVIESDVIDYLKQIKDNTLSVVTGFHIIEHVSFEILIKLFDETLRVVKPGGMVIFETPNPENILVGACTFYTDPTHNHPIPPQTAAYFMEARGFVDIEIMRLHQNQTIHIEDPFLNHQFTVGQDYAVMGIKS